MDYAAHEIRWRCVQPSCTLWAKAGMHSMALQDCISHEKFCNHFSIHFEKCIPYKVDHDVNISSNAEPKRCPKVSVSGNKRVDVSGANELKSKNSNSEEE